MLLGAILDGRDADNVKFLGDRLDPVGGDDPLLAVLYCYYISIL